MPKLAIILKDQLSLSVSSLKNIDKNNDMILMHESISEFNHVKHHKKKIAFIISSMRHFASLLIDSGYNVKYIKLEDKNNSSSLFKEVSKIISDPKHDISEIFVTHPCEYRSYQELNNIKKNIKTNLFILEDDRFLCSIDEFRKWSSERKQLRMEFFYREMRKKYSILMDGDKPEGGKWNYDSENRKGPDKNLKIPPLNKIEPDEITKESIKVTIKFFNDHFGDIEPFFFAVTSDQAKIFLDLFIKDRLYNFGTYQDAMIQNEPWMYHSHISFYLNNGLLLPIDCIKAAVEAYNKKLVPLNAAEGFIRQILGWREYVRGIYWLKMPEYAKLNYLNATKNLPEFYWNHNTDMNCLKQCVIETKKHAYAHHIQRLMVLGNFALISGIDPEQVNEWFLIVYADAYEWVEMPNVSGMTLFADNGYLASKPYASSGSYIKKMSNYCSKCKYDVNQKLGKEACPFNYLYWDFLIRNKNKLSKNIRLQMIYKAYENMTQEKKDSIKTWSELFLNNLK